MKHQILNQYGSMFTSEKQTQVIHKLRAKSIHFRNLFCKTVLLVFISVYTSTQSFGHGVAIYNMALSNQDVVNDFTLVNFDINWNNSWRTSTGPQNWDACWVFVKFKVAGQPTWKHATLNTTGHTAPPNSTITTTTDGKGMFIYSSINIGQGSVWYPGVKLRWNYGVDGVLDNDKVEVMVFAIEMVYVPQGSFYVGDGTTVTASIFAQFERGTTGTPYQVTSEAAITLGGGGATSLGNNNSFRNSLVLDNDDFNDVTTQTLPAAFPKGFNAFYCMKYEITQEQYVQFLNTLTYTQQVSCTRLAPNSPTNTLALAIVGSEYRNGIVVWTPGVSPNTPAVYACNLDGDFIYDEPNDGHNVACNYMSWGNFASYLDWAGLRPMTELEYEKACRGNLTPVLNEYAWGNTTLTPVAGVTNSGANSESPSNAAANCVCAFGVPGVMRVGCLGFGINTRTATGSSYYGIMELSGNFSERVISVGYFANRRFTGVHGDGALDANGDYNIATWPVKIDIYSGFTLIEKAATGYRGGHFAINAARYYELQTSNRAMITNQFNYGDGAVGGRGVRTAP